MIKSPIPKKISRHFWYPCIPPVSTRGLWPSSTSIDSINSNNFATLFGQNDNSCRQKVEEKTKYCSFVSYLYNDVTLPRVLNQSSLLFCDLNMCYTLFPRIFRGVLFPNNPPEEFLFSRMGHFSSCRLINVGTKGVKHSVRVNFLSKISLNP